MKQEGWGLYLVRKYISELGGDIIICSGSEIISLENGGYILEDENYYLRENKSEIINDAFEGTFITLRIPYKKNMFASDKSQNQETDTDLINILKE